MSADPRPADPRSPSTARLLWHYEGEGMWWAESPEYPEWSCFADSLDGARRLAHAGLRFCAGDDAVTIIDPFGPLPAAEVTT